MGEKFVVVGGDAALHAGMTVAELGALDFGYSPPFGPVLTAAKALGDRMESDDGEAHRN